MKILQSFLALVLLLGASPAAWAQADPVKEVRDIGAKRGQAFTKGDADAFTADLADNVVFTSALAGFRMEGKQAVRAYFAQLFQNYPTRQTQTRQPLYRVFQNGTVVMYNYYQDQRWGDRAGYVNTAMVRQSQTWIKADGRWQLVEWHLSKMPGTQ